MTEIELENMKCMVELMKSEFSKFRSSYICNVGMRAPLKRCNKNSNELVR